MWAILRRDFIHAMDQDEPINRAESATVHRINGVRLPGSTPCRHLSQTGSLRVYEVISARIKEQP
jgi:hypothetical protein